VNVWLWIKWLWRIYRQCFDISIRLFSILWLSGLWFYLLVYNIMGLLEYNTVSEYKILYSRGL
jgi:hypothetical protein